MKIALIVLMCMYLSIFAGFYFFQEKLIFYPQRAPGGSKSIARYEHLEITMEVDEVTLHGWLLSEGKEKLIVYYGGNAEEVSHTIDDFRHLKKYTVLLMNYRGYGKSEGTPEERSLCKDALHIFDYITDTLDFQPENSVLFGRSLGTSIALYVASKRKVSSIILVTPFDSIQNIVQDKIPIIPVDLIMKHPFNSLPYAEEVRCPSLVLIAKEDRVIKNTYSINLVKHMRGKCTYHIIENAGHNNIHTYPEYWELISDHLNE